MKTVVVFHGLLLLGSLKNPRRTNHKCRKYTTNICVQKCTSLINEVEGVTTFKLQPQITNLPWLQLNN